MSLDVYLRSGPNYDALCLRVYGNKTHELTWGQWLEKFPDLVPQEYVESLHETLYSSNITHNLGTMAIEAGIYECVWEPNEHGFTIASQIVELLRAGIARLEADPDRFKPLSASNGWGTYEQFIPWLKKYLEALEMHPDASVNTSV